MKIINKLINNKKKIFLSSSVGLYITKEGVFSAKFALKSLTTEISLKALKTLSQLGALKR